tara:strand:- start:1280 stop:1666 length:387 start_codon:yes stop_codon:yes gene_type:complete
MTALLEFSRGATIQHLHNQTEPCNAKMPCMVTWESVNAMSEMVLVLQVESVLFTETPSTLCIVMVEPPQHVFVVVVTLVVVMLKADVPTTRHVIIAFAALQYIQDVQMPQLMDKFCMLAVLQQDSMRA